MRLSWYCLQIGELLAECGIELYSFCSHIGQLEYGMGLSWYCSHSGELLAKCEIELYWYCSHFRELEGKG